MKWLSEIWATADRWTRVALIAAVVIVVVAVLWLLGAGGLAGLGTWLGSN